MKKLIKALGVMSAIVLAYTTSPAPAEAQLQRWDMCKLRVTRPAEAVKVAKRACNKQKAELAARKKKKKT